MEESSHHIARGRKSGIKPSEIKLTQSERYGNRSSVLVPPPDNTTFIFYLKRERELFGPNLLEVIYSVTSNAQMLYQELTDK